MSAQQQQQSIATTSQSSTEGQRQVVTTEAKQSGNYTSDIQIIDILAKIMTDKTMNLTEKNKQINLKKQEMYNSLIKGYIKSNYIKKNTRRGKTSYSIDIYGGTNPESKQLLTFDTMEQAEEAYNKAISILAKKDTNDIFAICKQKLDSNPEYLEVFKHAVEKAEIMKQETELIYQKTKLVSQKQSLDKEIAETTAKLVTQIDIYNKSSEREFQMAKTAVKTAQADLNTAIQNQNAQALLNAQKQNTDAVKNMGRAITNGLATVTVAINNAAVAAADDAADNASAAAAAAAELQAALKVNSENTNAAINELNKTVVAVAKDAEAAQVKLREDVAKIADGLEKIKEELNKNLNKLAEAAAKDPTVQMTPKDLSDIFDNFLTCSAGYRWKMQIVYGGYGQDTDHTTLTQLEGIYSKKFDRNRRTPSKDYLRCDGGTHTLSLYDFNMMLKMNGLPQIDWKDTNNYYGIYNKFGFTASESYIIP
jgi:hypothetical protein